MRLRCQSEQQWLKKDGPPFTVPQLDPRRRRERMSCLSLLSDPRSTPLPEATTSPPTSSPSQQYALDMAGMSYAQLPVAQDKLAREEMSGWRQLWAMVSPDVHGC